ncbi:MAG: hypothetical protein R2800_14175 [Flavipsychrobacter sp.]
MSTDRIHIISEKELEIKNRGDWVMLAKAFVVLGLPCLVGYLIYNGTVTSIVEKRGFFSLFLVMAVLAYICFKGLISPLFLIDKNYRLLKDSGVLLVNGGVYTIDESSGIYRRKVIVSLGNKRGAIVYYVVGLRLREPSKVINKGLMICNEYETMSYAKVLANYTGLEIEDDILNPPDYY